MKSNPIYKSFLPLLALLVLFSPAVIFAQSDSVKKLLATPKNFHALNVMSCTGSLGDPIVNITFGKGANFGPPLAAGVTNMQYLASQCPNDGQYTIASYSTGCFSNSWHTISDHTGDGNGYYMLINASYTPSDFYVQQVDGLCSGTTYQFSAWAANVHNQRQILPNITFNIEKTDGTVLQSYNTGDMPTTSSLVWTQYAMYFTLPAGVSSVILRMKNNAPGGNGNDLALDDITFRAAGPNTKIGVAGDGDSINVCGSPVALTANIESCYLTNEYQWQISVNNGGWTDIPGATVPAYTVPVLSPGKYKYRLLVSQAGNIQISTCRVSSNITTVVVVPPAIKQAKAATICSGKSYTLPSGATVSAAGNYSDTVRYAFGCDSLITNLQLSVQSPISKNLYDTICQGSSYTLPNGTNISSAGLYRDTVRYVTGCDSLIRTINLFVRPVFTKDSFAVICDGNAAVLPWGQIASKDGVYSDTTRYVAGCDSLIRHVYLHVTVPSRQTIERFVCPNETYRLPSGAIVSTPGLYNDTLKTPMGCDSIITFLTLNPAPPPTIQLSKSNDVNCTLGISKLTASGGAKYSWSPAESLSNPNMPNPVASPATTTVYHVVVTTKLGCFGEDSIAVNVSADIAKNGIQIPNAFTPNGDGLNDCFGVKFLGSISNLKLSVYDRWGNRVFYTTNPNQCWDGRYKDRDLGSGIFIYHVSATTLCGNVEKKGTVTLIR
jgi:gliding motility-associated-like protein